MHPPRIIRVALPVPLDREFDFVVPPGLPTPPVGTRVRVPFGRRRLVGVVMGRAGASDLPLEKLRDVEEILDTEPIMSNAMLEWLERISEYYHHPIGDVLQTALPSVLRRGGALEPRPAPRYRLSHASRQAEPDFRRAPLQRRIWSALQGSAGLSADQLKELGGSWRRAIATMMANGWVEAAPQAADPATAAAGSAEPVELNAEQRRAAQKIRSALGSYRSFVLFGVTGSGKTEIYLEVMREAIEAGRQALVLVPEIGLTPQLVKRFEQSTRGRLVVLHSNLPAGERHRGWVAARSGSADIVLGTRSAVFTPLARPGVIVLDEEHDLSFKQQEGFRYHARDIAVLRAKRESVPVILGSATPSFETMANVAAGRYALLRLGSRALGAFLPRIDPVDMRVVPVEHGFSRTLIEAVNARLRAGEQSLIYINRRGYAPVLYCPECGWQAQCRRCDARLIYHRSDDRLRCHHCGSQRPAPVACPECDGTSMRPLGEGTQRLESHLRQLFPSASIVRIDRDSTRRRGELEQRLNQAASGEADILVGTQLLTKGHHFPMVTLVGVIDADQGLYSVDFRASEHLFQQIVQVAGRAGRADNPGQVLVQTVHPDHFHFSLLRDHDYAGFVNVALEERRQARHPPYSHFVLLRAESTTGGAGLSFLSRVRDLAAPMIRRWPSVQVMEPVPSPMEKRAGRYRAQLLISGERRPELHEMLAAVLRKLREQPFTRRVRWSVDVDPMEMY